MAQTRNILLGRIIKIHGYEGAVAVRLEKNFSENIPIMESVFLEIDGRPVPFFLDYFDQVNSEKAYLKFQDYDTIEKVKEFIGSNLFVSAGLVVEDPVGDQINLQGYTIFSGDNKPVGEVVEIIKNPAQWLLRVATGEGKDILIPLHEDMIIGIDESHKMIKMNIPKGLVDLN